MTLGELFEACQFEELIPCLRIHYGVEESLFKFKEAFDVYSRMYQELKEIGDEEIPKENYYSTTITLAGRMDSHENFVELDVNDFSTEPSSEEVLKEYSLNVMVSHLPGETALLVPAYVLKDLLVLTKGELLAHYLWEMTFYGLPEDFEEVRQDMMGEPVITNSYEKAYWDLSRKLSLNECPKKYRKEGYCPYGEELKRFNRSKRKRAYRQRERCKLLERMGKIENVIGRLSPIAKQDLLYLFQTDFIHECTYHSRTFGEGDRVGYLLDLYDRYDPCDYSGETNVAITFKASSEYPLTEEELSRLKEVEKRFNPSAPILWGIGVDDKLEEEISMLMVVSH